MNQIVGNKRFRMIGVVFLVVCLGVLIASSMRPSVTVNDPFDDRSFDQAVWLRHRNDLDQKNPRGLMAHDLATLLETERLTRAEVIALLGEPDAQPPDTALSYQLGMWSGFRMDYDTLDIYFDPTDHVADARVVQH